ncbi:hypothetical protein GGS23DRAFT_530891 [Durotheca rogersii]|uniref:uncharacterized protein n=1 Tax=Durotheca rogersii TaxID=419775 RepID=UPI00221EA943|nr:uncharacterized protein GGS23DRAFT_530891 [Durotheca rogersii]KAI5863387.1 hypothetical protein GGS23DRAFT_530891 [Durotheca rogersii]
MLAAAPWGSASWTIYHQPTWPRAPGAGLQLVGMGFLPIVARRTSLPTSTTTTTANPSTPLPPPPPASAAAGPSFPLVWRGVAHRRYACRQVSISQSRCALSKPPSRGSLPPREERKENKRERERRRGRRRRKDKEKIKSFLPSSRRGATRGRGTKSGFRSRNAA